MKCDGIPLWSLFISVAVRSTRHIQRLYVLCQKESERWPWLHWSRKVRDRSVPYWLTNLVNICLLSLQRRWGEVCLLSSSHRFDILAQGEVDRVDISLDGAAFQHFRYFHQPGENAHGGVLVLIHISIQASQVPCTPSNVCVIDIHMEESTRLVALVWLGERWGESPWSIGINVTIQAQLYGTCLLRYSPSPSGRKNGSTEWAMRLTANSLRFCQH